jgi:HAD superfamily hydrolase (TIGR01549 family)
MSNFFIKAILFDIGSTLVTGPEMSPSKEIAQLLEIDSCEVGKIIMQNSFTSPDSLFDHFKTIWKELNSSDREKIKTLWYRQEKDAKEIEGATETVQYCKQKGLKIGLISDIWKPYYKSFEKACPKIATLIDTAALSFQEGIKKPNTLLFTKALSALNTKPEETLIVGDTYKNDIEPAIKLGLRSVWILNRPDREIHDILNVINNISPKPDYAIEHIRLLMKLPILEDDSENCKSRTFFC